MVPLGLPKLNKSLVKLPSGVKGTASTNMATNSFNRVQLGNLSSSQGIFSSGTSYGVMAQRSYTGLGLHLNNYTGNSPKIAGWRNELFRSHTPVYNNLFGNYDYHKKPDDSMTDFQKAMFLTSMIGQTLTPIAKGVKDIIDDNNSTSSGKPGNTGNEEISNGLKGMKNANDSTTLEAAITSAKSELAGIPNKITSAKSDLATLKGKTQDLKTKSDDAQTKFTKHNEAVKTKTGEVNEAKGALDGCTNKYNSAKNEYDNSVLKFNAEEINFNTAKDAYNNCPDTITQTNPDGTTQQIPNPEKAILKTAMEAAEKAMETAKTAMETAKTAMEAAEKTKNEAEKKYTELDNQLTKLNDQTEQLKQDAEKAKADYDTNLKDIEAKQKEIEQLEKDEKELNAEIPKQEKRLNELQEKENKELNKLTGQISSTQGELDNLLKQIKPDDADGYSDKDKKTKEKADAKQAELDRLKARQAELEKRQAIRNLPTTTHNGVIFKSGYLPDGTHIYMVAGKEVTQNEYETQIQSAKT